MSTRIALLISGSLPDSDYSPVFSALLSHKFILDPYDVRQLNYPPDSLLNSGHYAAIMYTGSASNAYDDLPWINQLVSFTSRIITTYPNLKLIGICFGHQIIARALGGTCVPNNGLWEIGPTTLALSDLGKQLFRVEELNIQQMHRDHVPSLPPSNDIHLLASTPISPIQGMAMFFPSQPHTLQNTHILTLQGHPEFVQDIVDQLVELRSKSGIIPKDLAEEYFTVRREWRNDGVDVIGSAICTMLAVHEEEA